MLSLLCLRGSKQSWDALLNRVTINLVPRGSPLHIPDSERDWDVKRSDPGNEVGSQTGQSQSFKIFFMIFKIFIKKKGGRGD